MMGAVLDEGACEFLSVGHKLRHILGLVSLSDSRTEKRLPYFVRHRNDSHEPSSVQVARQAAERGILFVCKSPSRHARNKRVTHLRCSLVEKQPASVRRPNDADSLKKFHVSFVGFGASRAILTLAFSWLVRDNDFLLGT